MPRGGKTKTSWKPGWKHQPTQTIRVPIALAEQLLAIARALDSEQISQVEINQLIGKMIENKIRQAVDEILETARDHLGKPFDSRGLTFQDFKRVSRLIRVPEHPTQMMLTDIQSDIIVEKHVCVELSTEESEFGCVVRLVVF